MNTVLAQFPEIDVPVFRVPHVRRKDQIEDVISRVEKGGGTIVHTLVDENLRRTLNSMGKERDVMTIDLMGGLMTRLTDDIGQKPIGQPGLYRQIHHVYFDRVEAIEFSMAHDDGQAPQDLPMADIVLVGVSRLGKTPLSMYLSVLGWKVANVPLVQGIDPLPELFMIDRRRVIGLNIEPDQLLVYRKKRQRRMGAMGSNKYTNFKAIHEEVEAARRLFNRHHFTVIEVTNKPIETSADEIIEIITGRSISK